MTDVRAIPLNNGTTIPQLGYGVFQVPPAETKKAVAEALKIGYRHIDTAAVYGNEEGVGAAIAESGIDRDDLFITTKLWNADQGYDSALRAFDTSLGKLGLEQVDLYLIHWPVAVADRYADSWRALERLGADGRARAIGVSNFKVPHLERILKESEVVPAVNQIELHPYLSQAPQRAFDAEHGIVTEAWSPLGQGGPLLSDPTVTAIARKHDATPAQVVLAWHLQAGLVVIPKSVTPSRMRENLAAVDLVLDADDVAALDALNTDTRVGPDPDVLTAGL